MRLDVLSDLWIVDAVKQLLFIREMVATGNKQRVSSRHQRVKRLSRLYARKNLMECIDKTKMFVVNIGIAGHKIGRP